MSGEGLAVEKECVETIVIEARGGDCREIEESELVTKASVPPGWVHIPTSEKNEYLLGEIEKFRVKYGHYFLEELPAEAMRIYQNIKHTIKWTLAEHLKPETLDSFKNLMKGMGDLEGYKQDIKSIT